MSHNSIFISFMTEFLSNKSGKSMNHLLNQFLIKYEKMIFIEKRVIIRIYQELDHHS